MTDQQPEGYFEPTEKWPEPKKTGKLSLWTVIRPYLAWIILVSVGLILIGLSTYLAY